MQHNKLAMHTHHVHTTVKTYTYYIIGVGDESFKLSMLSEADYEYLFQAV